MPKVELHVHLEGSVQPQTLLKLAQKYAVELPRDDLEGLKEWFSFRDFNHFVEIYLTISGCLKSGADIELITRDFLTGQAAQNIGYSEVTFTPYNQYLLNGLDFHEQLDAVNRARSWAAAALGVQMGVIIDIPRLISPEPAEMIADWAIERFGDGLIAFGLGGPEVGNPPQKFQAVFDRVRAAGIPCILHAGETDTAESIWQAITVADTRRIGHGVRAIEDPALMDYLRDRQIPLEVCPTSNLCLGVYPSLAEHSLPKLLEHGLYITINSDDPPMFNTTLTQEFLICQKMWNWDYQQLEQLSLNAINASLRSPEAKALMREQLASFLSENGPESAPL